MKIAVIKKLSDLSDTHVRRFSSSAWFIFDMNLNRSPAGLYFIILCLFLFFLFSFKHKTSHRQRKNYTVITLLYRDNDTHERYTITKPK